MFFTALLTSMLLATSALAVPSRLAAHVAAHSTRPLQPLRVNRTAHAGTNNVSRIEHHSDWAGAVYRSYREYLEVCMLVVLIPTLSAGTGNSDSNTTSAWVGLGAGVTHPGKIQIGVDFTIRSNSTVSYDAWCKYKPSYPKTFLPISLSAGDVVTLKVTAETSSWGTLVIENTTTGKKLTWSVTWPWEVSQETAEWIIGPGDLREDGKLEPFANFGTVTFTDAYAFTNSHNAFGPGSYEGALLSVILQDNKVLAEAFATNVSSVTIKYLARGARS